jgi:hypothetical protein
MASRDMKRPNPLSSYLMTAAERRAELCAILARGLLRLRSRTAADSADTLAQAREHGDIPLHPTAHQRRHAKPKPRRPA